MLDDAARLRASTAADDATATADRKARSLAMQAKLRDIAEAQVNRSSRPQLIMHVMGHVDPERFLSRQCT